MVKSARVFSVRAEEAAKVAASLEASPQRTPFAEPGWLSFLSDLLRGAVYLLVYENGGEVKAFLPVWETAYRFVGKVAEIPPLTPYWGPVLAPSPKAKIPTARARDHAALAALAGELRRRYRYARVVAHPSLVDLRPFGWGGFRSEVRYTSVLAPADPGEYLAALPGPLRNKIRQGDPDRVVSSLDVEPLASLYVRTFERGECYCPVGAEFLKALARRLGPGRFEVFYYLDDEGNPAAGRLVVWGERAAYDLVAAATAAGRGPRGAYLAWRVIQACWERGCALDYVGVNVPAIASFKDSFGGDVVPYYLLTSHRSAWHRLAVAAVRKYLR